MKRARYAVGLRAHHVDQVRQVVQANPGAALRKLCGLVALDCGLPNVALPQLHQFLARHQIVRRMPVHVVERRARLVAAGRISVPTPMEPLAGDGGGV